MEIQTYPRWWVTTLWIQVSPVTDESRHIHIVGFQHVATVCNAQSGMVKFYIVHTLAILILVNYQYLVTIYHLSCQQLAALKFMLTGALCCSAFPTDQIIASCNFLSNAGWSMVDMPRFAGSRGAVPICITLDKFASPWSVIVILTSACPGYRFCNKSITHCLLYPPHFRLNDEGFIKKDNPGIGILYVAHILLIEGRRISMLPSRSDSKT